MKIIHCRLENNKPTAILKKDNNTYSFVERKSQPFNLNSFLELNSQIDAKLKWVSEIEYLRRYSSSFKESQINRTKLQETESNYCLGLDKYIEKNQLSFKSIYKYNISQVPKSLHYTSLFDSLNNGTKIIENEDILRNYIACYGGHHYHKLQSSCRILSEEIQGNKSISIIDYGCGQALASTVFYNYLLRNNINLNIEEIVLIEPSNIALERGIYHLNKFIDKKGHFTTIRKINKSLNEITISDINTNNKAVKIHFFSNILDVITFDIEKLADKIKQVQQGENYFICLSPYNNTASLRINQFINQFKSKEMINAPSSAFNGKIYNVMTKSWSSKQITKYQRIFKTEI